MQKGLRGLISPQPNFVTVIRVIDRVDSRSKGDNFPSSFPPDDFSCTAKLLQRRNTVEVLGDVRIEDGAIVFGHLKSRMAQQLLERKRIAAAVNQILSGKGVSEHMERCLRHSPLPVVSFNRQSKGICCEHFPILIAEQVVIRLPFPDTQILFQAHSKGRAQRNDLNLTRLSMTECDLLAVQIQIPNLDVPYR